MGRCHRWTDLTVYVLNAEVIINCLTAWVARAVGGFVLHGHLGTLERAAAEATDCLVLVTGSSSYFRCFDQSIR